MVFESRASDIYLIVEEGFYKRTLDIHRTLGLLLHTQVSIQQLLKLPAECFHPKPKVNSVLIKLTRHTTDVPDKYWKLYTYFVSKWVNREYRQLFTKNQFHQAMKHAKVNNLSTITYEQVLSIFNSYLLFNGRKLILWVAFLNFGKLHVTKGNGDKLLDILLTASKKLKRSLAPTGNLYR